MILISEQIKKDTDLNPYSTLVSRYEKWFSNTYIDKTLEPIERKDDILLIPGKIYTFAYDPSDEYKDKSKFFSYMPINLILGQKLTKAGNLLPYGINLSFVPPSIRIKILDQITRIWNSDIIKPNIERIKEGKFTIHEIPIFYDVAKKILDGSGFEYAIRSYRYERFGNMPSIISYEDWHKICYFHLKYVAKMQIRAIYVMYMKNIQESYKVGKKYDVNLPKTKIKEVKEYFSKREKY